LLQDGGGLRAIAWLQNGELDLLVFAAAVEYYFGDAGLAEDQIFSSIS
jgi:hypothetical protein